MGGGPENTKPTSGVPRGRQVGVGGKGGVVTDVGEGKTEKIPLRTEIRELLGAQPPTGRRVGGGQRSQARRGRVRGWGEVMAKRWRPAGAQPRALLRGAARDPREGLQTRPRDSGESSELGAQCGKRESLRTEP